MMNIINTLLETITVAAEPIFKFTPENFMPSLVLLGKGMVGIFVVMALIYGLTLVLNRFGGKDE